MRKRAVLATGLLGVTLALAGSGCGDPDNIELCDGCGPTPTVTSTPGTPTPTATAQTPTPSPVPSSSPSSVP